MAARHAANWSLLIGHLRGVPIRLHFFFLVFAVLAMAFAYTDGMLPQGLIALGILFGSLVLHELAHTLAARRLGGEVDQIVIGPFGGLASPRVPDEPEVQVCVSLAGPLVHLALLMLAAMTLAVGAGINVAGLMNPTIPFKFMDFDGNSYWRLAGAFTFWVNWMLMLLNLLPVYPFDGGPALRAVLWPVLGRRTAAVVTSRVAMVVAVGLCIVPLFVEADPQSSLPLWVPLVTLAIFLFFSAQQDVVAVQRSSFSDDDLPGYHLHEGGTDLLEELWSDDEDEDDAVLVQQRYDQRLARREQARQAEEDYEDAQVDDILARLHETSFDDLTGEERALLKRASERYRRRHESHDE